MKKLLCMALALLCLGTLMACRQEEEVLDFVGTQFFYGQILEVYEESFLLKITDLGDCFFYDEEVTVHDVYGGAEYAVGDHVRIEYGGVLLEYDPPRVGARSITKTDPEGNVITDTQEAFWDGKGCRIPSVYVNDRLYVSASYPSGYSMISSNCLYLGEVTECVGTGNTPAENFQANHAPVGTKIYQYHSVILLEVDGIYGAYVEDATESA